MKTNSLVFFLVFCWMLDTRAQNRTYKDSVDLLLKQAGKGNRIYHEKDSTGKLHYCYNQRQKQIVTIIFLPSDNDAEYDFYFLAGQLVKIHLLGPYSLSPQSRGKPMRAAYYLREGHLLQKIETNYPPVDIDFYKTLGLQLLERANRWLAIH